MHLFIFNPFTKKKDFLILRSDVLVSYQFTPNPTISIFIFVIALEAEFLDMMNSAEELQINIFKRFNTKISNPKFKAPYCPELRKFALTLSLYSASAYRYSFVYIHTGMERL